MNLYAYWIEPAANARPSIAVLGAERDALSREARRLAPTSRLNGLYPGLWHTDIHAQTDVGSGDHSLPPRPES